MTGPRGSFPLGISATSGPKPQVKAVEIICELEGGGTQTFTLTGPTEGHVEVPFRIVIVDGRIQPEFPEQCEHSEPGRPSDDEDVREHVAWALRMQATHNQRQCKGCGLWAVWEVKSDDSASSTR